jgi:hypothetical protein
MAWLHVPAVLWAAGIDFLGGICPLTPLGLTFDAWPVSRAAGDFIEHYVVSLLYRKVDPPGSSRAGCARAGVQCGNLRLGMASQPKAGVNARAALIVKEQP